MTIASGKADAAAAAPAAGEPSKGDPEPQLTLAPSDEPLPDPNPAPLPSDIPAKRPKCCDSPLVVSIQGRRWRPRSAFVLQSKFKEGMLSYVLSDKVLSRHAGCTEMYPTFDRNVFFFAKPDAKRIEIDPGMPLLFNEYQGNNKSLSINSPEGSIVLSEVTPEHVRGTLSVDYSRDTWAVGSFEAAVCP